VERTREELCIKAVANWSGQSIQLEVTSWIVSRSKSVPSAGLLSAALTIRSASVSFAAPGLNECPVGKGNNCASSGKSVYVSFEAIMQQYAACFDSKPALVAGFFIIACDYDSRVGRTVAMTIKNKAADRLERSHWSAILNRILLTFG